MLSTMYTFYTENMNKIEPHISSKENLIKKIITIMMSCTPLSVSTKNYKIQAKRYTYITGRYKFLFK
jgi:hypothetical protein